MKKPSTSEEWMAVARARGADAAAMLPNRAVGPKISNNPAPLNVLRHLHLILLTGILIAGGCGRGEPLEPENHVAVEALEPEAEIRQLFEEARSALRAEDFARYYWTLTPERRSFMLGFVWRSAIDWTHWGSPSAFQAIAWQFAVDLPVDLAQAPVPEGLLEADEAELFAQLLRLQHGSDCDWQNWPDYLSVHPRDALVSVSVQGDNGHIVVNGPEHVGGTEWIIEVSRIPAGWGIAERR